ncbi:MAG: hypothetical protein N4A46_11750, partial [Schleiferiaceae bacterium]|nr:hypothetical protein [Schleiferiaceae bacterium]
LSLLEKYEEATEVLESGVIYVIKNPQLKEQFYIQLAEAYNYLEDYSSSDLNFNNALSINPKNPTTLNNYAYYLALREDQLDKAKELAERCNELVPNNAVFLDTYAWVMYKKGDYSKAFSLMEKVMSINKNPQSDVLEHMGDILYRLNRKEEAFEYWNQAKEKGEGSEFLNKKIKNQKLYE